MNQKDIIKDWFKELPQEQPSPEFAIKVMQRVMSEWTLNPIKYQPIISRKGWWTLGFFALLLTSMLFMLHPSLSPAAGSATEVKTVFGLDISKLFETISQLFERLTNTSPAVAIGALAIIALWFFDQLFVKTVRH